MAYTFGVCNSSPAVVQEVLIKHKLAEERDISIVQLGDVLPKKSKHKVLFLVSIQDLLRNLDKINSNSYKDRAIFVFASPIRLEELDGVTVLDMTKDKSVRGFGFILENKINVLKLKAAFKKAPAVSSVARSEFKPLAVLTESVKKGSLLTPLMTFIYSLPSATLQTPVKEAVARILIKGLPLSHLDKVLAKASGYSLTDKMRKTLVDILSSEIGLKYRAALEEYAKVKETSKASAIQGIAKRNDVSSYEIKYLLSILAEKGKPAKKPDKKKKEAK